MGYSLLEPRLLTLSMVRGQQRSRPGGVHRVVYPGVYTRLYTQVVYTSLPTQVVYTSLPYPGGI